LACVGQRLCARLAGEMVVGAGPSVRLY
jgi:hypothetical protein